MEKRSIIFKGKKMEILNEVVICLLHQDLVMIEQ